MSAQSIDDDPGIARGHLTAEQFDRMVGPDVWDGDPVELLEGVLVEVVPQGVEHLDALLVLTRWFVRRAPDPWFVSVQLPFTAGPRSTPEPDLALVRRRRGERPSEAALVVEVSGSTHRLDLVHKPRIYAAAGVPVYWVIDLPAREVVVHTGPREGGYADVERLPWTTPVTAVVDGVELALLLSDVLTDVG